MTRRVTMALVVAALLIAADAPKDDKDTLQGSWGTPSMEFAGMRLDGPADQRLVFAGDQTWPFPRTSRASATQVDRLHAGCQIALKKG